MSEPFIGQIVMFGGNFAPRSWALCDGQLLPIAQNSALFSILGTTYGGDGRTTFGLPDLRGRYAMHAGNGPGLTTHPLGQKSGTETVTLTTQQMPSHIHGHQTDATLRASQEAADANDPMGNDLGLAPAYQIPAVPPPVPDPRVNMAPGIVDVPDSDSVGGSSSHNNMPPYQAVNFIIALQGTFPSRN